MSDPNRPGDVPPELPPEYAEAYRRGYERTYQQAADEDEADAEPEADVERTTTRGRRPLFADEVDEATARTSPTSGGAHRADPTPVVHEEQVSGPDPDRRREPGERPAWLVPALLAGLVVALLLGAYGIGRVLSASLSGSQATHETADGVVTNEDGSTSTPSSKTTKRPQGKKYAGDTVSADIGEASASCESKSGVDSAGHRVGYDPSNVYDRDMTTAWRCDGDGSGQRLTLVLADVTKIGQVGLVPGYAKTDPRSGVNRYAENNRITKVRWVFDSGTALEQTFDPSPRHRSVQAMRIPVTKAGRVVVEILGSHPGPRNTVAVSELRIGQVDG